MMMRFGLKIKKRAGGFTLIEASLTTVIVGVGIAATMMLFFTSTRNNAFATHGTIGMMLAGHIQEAMAPLSFNDPITAGNTFGAETGQTLDTFDDVDDFDGLTLTPPIDALRRPISNMGQYTQVIRVVPVYARKLSVSNDPDHPEIPLSTYTGAVRVTVRVLYAPRPGNEKQEVAKLSWIRVDG